MGDRISGYPPLAGSEWLTGDPEVPIRIVLNGLAGEIVVKGETYGSTAMTPQAPMFYSDAEFAAVLTFARSQWGNTGSAITADQIAAVKAQYAGKGTENPADLAEKYNIGAEPEAPEEAPEASEEAPEAPEDPAQPEDGSPD